MQETNNLGRWELVNRAGEPVEEGQEVRSHRGAWGVVTGGIPPRHGGSTGRIEVDGVLFYPSVYGCRWERAHSAAVASGRECPECSSQETESNGGTEYRCVACDHRWGIDGEPYGYRAEVAA
jgi:hypothetical protein